MKKVLIINQVPEVNNKYTFSLARSLINKGVDVSVCGIVDDDVSQYLDVPYLRLFESYSTQRNLLKKVIVYYKSWRSVITYCKKNNVDIVHTQWRIFSPLDWYFQKLLQNLGIKVIVTVHDLLPFNRKFYDFYYHKKIYLHANSIISQSKNNVGDLVGQFEVNKNCVYYIPHGHYMQYAEYVDSSVAKEKLGIDRYKKVILFFGQIKKVKGVDILIKSMKKVKEKHPDALCLIAGKVWKDDFEVYEQLIRKLDLDKQIRRDIRFIKDDEVKYYFGSAEMVVLPYRKIYQSGVVLLGVAYKKPIIATTEGEFLQVIQNHKTGLLVKSENYIELANAIEWYLDHPADAKKYAENCWEDLNIRLSWDTISKKILQVYNK